MDPTATPPRDDGDAMDEEPEMPLRDRMAQLQEELADAQSLLDKVASGHPKLSLPVTIAEAFDLADAAQAAKAKENVSLCGCLWASHHARVVVFFPSSKVGVGGRRRGGHINHSTKHGETTQLQTKTQLCQLVVPSDVC